MTDENRIESLLSEDASDAAPAVDNTAPAVETPEKTTQPVEQESDDSADERDADEGDAEEKKAKSKYVPLQELKREREKRQEAERKAQEYREQVTRFDERFNILQQTWAQQNQPKQPEIPAFDQDPAGHLKAQTDMTRAELERQRAEIERQRALGDLANYVRTSQLAFKEKQPDYFEAYNFLKKNRAQEIMAISGCTEEQALQAVEYDELELVANNRRAGKNVAETVYALAKQRGYTAKNVAEDATKTLERITQGQKDSKSLSGVGGNASPRLTAESLAAMTDEEFAELNAKNPKAIREIMGG